MTTTNTATEKLTHNLRLWINNDEGMTEQLNEIAEAHELNEYDTARAFESYFQDEELWADYAKLNPIHKELLEIAIAFIDWQELAKDMIETIKENNA